MTKPLKIAVIPDTQVKPDIDLSWLEHIGNYLVEKQPDAIVHLGDFADMPSLCVAPDTAVLRGDFSWSRAEDLRIGDDIIGFIGGKPGGKGKSFRKLRPGKVTNNTRFVAKSGYKITTEHGTVVCSHDHKFMSYNDDGAKRAFRTCAQLRVGWKIMSLGSDWLQPSGLTPTELGYLAGFLDGEGSYAQGRLTWSQNDGAVASYVLTLFDKLQVEVGYYSDVGRPHLKHYYVKGTYLSSWKVLHYCRPVRLLPKLIADMDGKTCSKFSGSKDSSIVSIEPLESVEVIGLETDVNTYISNSLFSHNCSYDKGKKSFEGRRYKKDIESVHEGMRTLLRPLYRYNDTHSRHKKKKYSPYMLMLGGNHECYDNVTEVLTEDGWKLIKDWNGEQVYTFNTETHQGEWQYPTHKIEKPYKGSMLYYSSRTMDMCVTPNHNVMWETCGGTLRIAPACTASSSCDVIVAAESSVSSTSPFNMTLEQVRFCAVACTDASHHKDRVVFYQSEKKRKLIEKIIEEAGVPILHTSVRDRDIKQICGRALKKKPQTSYEYHMERPEWCLPGNRRLPQFAYSMPKGAFDAFLDTLVLCDGTIPTGSTGNCLVFYGRKEICEDVQIACVLHGYRATLTEYRPNQWRVNITKTNKCRTKDWLTSSIEYDGYVYCLTVPNGTLLTRRNNKPVFCGNCRITRAIEDDPKLDGTIGLSDLKYEEFGWEVSPFLKVEQVGGICFSHYFVSGVMGRPITSAQALLTKKHVSCIAGHQQGKQIATATRGDGKRITGIITGSCLAPEHKVLTADLRYVPLGDIKVGDKLVSFDEHIGMSAKRSRRYKTGTVRAVRRNVGEMFEVTLENGKKFRATADHLWLTKNCMGVTRWQRTKDLTYTKYHVNQNTKVSRVLPEWETANTRTAGWLAGMYDGEGSLHARTTTGGACVNLQISQSPEKNLSTCVRLVEAHKEFGFILGEATSHTRTCKSWRIAGGRAEVARLLGMIRPQRLLDKFSPELLGTLATKYEEPLDSIMDVRSIGEGEYVEIDIDAATMIVEGYPHHNCYPHDESYLGPQGNEHWRGMLMCYEVVDGQFDEGFISLNYLRSKYA